MFFLTKYRKSIPKSWCRLWKDQNGKQIIIKPTRHDFYSVTILGSNSQPFKIELLDDNVKNTTGLIGRIARDLNGRPILQVEAGIDGIGPTYDLCFLTIKENGKTRLARNTDNINKIIILPNIGIGLYDDWEDDLGVPWALPLEEFKSE